MANLPYVTATGNIAKAIDAIKKAATPPKVSGDFVKNILGIKGGSGDQITSFLKKIGLADAGGSPTELYNKLRNPTTSGEAIAECLRIAYQPLFERNEYVYSLDDEALKGLIIDETGNADDSNPVKMALSSFKALNEFADFSGRSEIIEKQTATLPEPEAPPAEFRNLGQVSVQSPKLNIGYNIHLNLPATDDISVFNAIFKSLKENLLIDD